MPALVFSPGVLILTSSNLDMWGHLLQGEHKSVGDEKSQSHNQRREVDMSLNQCPSPHRVEAIGKVWGSRWLSGQETRPTPKAKGCQAPLLFLTRSFQGEGPAETGLLWGWA